jgi:sulfide:quinone oxidoreductase
MLRATRLRTIDETKGGAVRANGAASVLIAGGGVAALEAALALREYAGERVAVELIAPEPHFWYRPLSVVQPFREGDVTRFELGDLAARASATVSPGSLVAVDAPKHLAYTSAGSAIEYDSLLIACGAIPRPAVPGAITFRGPADVERVGRLLGEVAAGRVRSIAFTAPLGAVWVLPMYELALMTAAALEGNDLRGVELAVVTPEEEPLGLFGASASAAIAELLVERGIALHTRAYPAEVVAGELRLFVDGSVVAERVVALPRLEGPSLDGVPQTIDGFVPVDIHGRVHGLEDVYAAGDVTSFPVKQGGIATQQADAAAEAIAAAAGADLDPQPFRPVLRGLLLTGSQPRYLRHELAGGAGDTSAVSPEPLWWPPAKIVGRHLAPFLAELAGIEAPPETPVRDAVAVERVLDAGEVGRLTARRRPGAGGASGRTVGDVMSTEPLVVAPEDTLGEVAEKMSERDFASALVADYGRLIGVLTARDLLRAFAGRIHSSEARVREWMTAEPLSVPADATLDEAAFLMTEHGIHHLAVVEGERPIGMVGLRDVTRAAVLDRSPIGIGLGF